MSVKTARSGSSRDYWSRKGSYVTDIVVHEETPGIHLRFPQSQSRRKCPWPWGYPSSVPVAIGGKQRINEGRENVKTFRINQVAPILPCGRSLTLSDNLTCTACMTLINIGDAVSPETIQGPFKSKGSMAHTSLRINSRRASRVRQVTRK